MLVFSRTKEMTVVIGGAGLVMPGPVVVTVVGTGNGKVRLGFEGDPSIPIHRGEVWSQIHNDQAQSGDELRAAAGI